MTTTLPDANDFLFGNSKPTAKFEKPGDAVGGIITRHPETAQQTEFGNRDKLLTWPDGRPKLQVIISVQTDQRDPSVENDDGVRRVFIKGRNMERAVRDAVRGAGANGLEMGGHFSMTFTGYGQGENPANPPKDYQCRYVSAANAALMGDQQGQAPTAPQQNGMWNGGQQQSAPVQQHAPVQHPVQQVPAQTAPQQAPAAAQPAQAVRDETGVDPEFAKAIAHLPIDQQNALVQAFLTGGMTVEMIKAMGL